MATIKPGHAVGAAVTAAIVASTVPGLTSAAHALPAVDGHVQNPSGEVALTWTPTYMSDDHAYTAEQAEDMARRFDLIAAMPIAFQKYAGQMRTANPDLTLIAYSNATILGAPKATGVPETAFAHDLTGSRIMLPEFNSYLMEPTNPTWMSSANQMCVERSAKGGYDGCLVDNMTLGIWSKGYVTGLPVKPGTSRIYTQAEYQQALIALGQYYRAQSPELVHAANAIENSYRYWHSDVKSSLTAKSLPGAQMEDFLRGASSPVGEFPQGQEWLDNVAVVKDLEASGQTGLFTTKLWVGATEDQVGTWQRLAMATFLMGADGDSYLAFTRSRDKAGAMGSNAPYEMPNGLGAVTGEMTQHSSGAYFRDFANGVSLANPTPSTVTVEFDAPVRNLDGQTVSSVTLPPNGADVLLGTGKAIQVGVADTTKPVAGFTSAVADATGVTVTGVATDDNAVSAVAVAVRNNDTLEWLGQDGTWGNYQEHAADLVGSGTAKATWSKRFALKPGRYGFIVIATDGAANQNDARPWEDVTVTDGSDLVAPTGAFGAITNVGSAVTVTGTAQDNKTVSKVGVAIRNQVTRKWLRRDGTWGSYQSLPATVVGAGTTKATWTFRTTLPAGSYGASLSVIDGANNALDPEPWQTFRVG